MRLRVLRYSSDATSTLGILLIDDEFAGYTLEDEKRDTKVRGETRIPAGTYQITLRTEGGFHERYAHKFGAMHKGMLWVRNVPGFEYILIHIGNTDADTAGCLLVGDEVKTQERKLLYSKNCYVRIYERVSAAILAGECVGITYEDIA